MKAQVAITDLTRMQAGRVCVAGYLPDGTCIRPVFRSGHLTEDWLKAREQVIIRPFAVVEFEIGERRVAPPHTEDRVIDRVYRRPRGILSTSQRRELLGRTIGSNVRELFGAALHHSPGWYVRAGEGKRSLGTILPARLDAITYQLRASGEWLYRLAFVDAAGESYELSVSDLAFRYRLDFLRVVKSHPADAAADEILRALRESELYLRIGLARHWEKYPDCCFLQITGVHSFPDYLSGHCYADFACQSGAGH